ncbi:hypothetical protein DKX38_005667 [Salix brachista]|uniref:non-specific serine/threonine protein kinase n=1 Tax=Salix brachista TaxID=2182728 RepID=A0A5N5MZX9_9ROSI|nr:hypothetical protein DKX38_005667 [Salix brachista]
MAEDKVLASLIGRNSSVTIDLDGEEMTTRVADGNDPVTGHIISTTIGGKNGEPKQTISYMAERVVGTGSFGVVFQAKCLETGETVAIKKVLQDRRYKNRELQLMRVMDHPNVISLKHCFFSTTNNNELFLNLVMEYVPESMYRVLKHYSNAKQSMPLIYVKLYMYQIFRGLAYIHAVPGVCHRDLKPQNLLVDPLTHQVKLCDFGSAKVLFVFGILAWFLTRGDIIAVTVYSCAFFFNEMYITLKMNVSRNIDGMQVIVADECLEHSEYDVKVKGEANISYICSRFYRAPELIFGATEYTTSIDIWSAGCVLAELLLGQPLFPGENAVDQLVEIIKVLGTPTREEIRCMNPNYTDFRFPQIKAHPWHKVFHKRMPPEAIDLASRLLQYSPSLRCTALEACAHPFFDELREPNARLPNGRSLPSLFNFKQELNGASPELVNNYFWGVLFCVLITMRQLPSLALCAKVMLLRSLVVTALVRSEDAGCVRDGIMELRILFRRIFWVDFAQATDSLLSPKGVNYEVAALMAVKKEMRDETGAMNGWDLNSVDPCTWKMVGCSPEGFVISLEMASARLSGTLSPSVGNLSHLRTMLLQSNHLSGPIPEEIGKLSDLQTLDLSGNQFVGGIPSSLGFLTHLSYLDLSFNNLSGPTPKILAKGYSITGNSYLCTSSLAQKCTGISNPVNETLSSEQASSHHRWVLSLAIVQQDYEFDIGHLKRFSFRELQVATNNFSPKNILGQGGYGVVYKGCLPNKTFIAVKRLKDPNFTGELQFQTEVEMIGLALHRNLLCLYGFCMTSDERLLVYPYMPNGSVADRLRVRGTVGHIAPEYLSTGQSSDKTDVFGFGILLLELITGQKALDAGNGQVQKGMILDWVRTLHEEKRLEVLVDRDLKGCFDESELEKAVDLALQCTQSHPNLRPKMSAVLKVLEGLAGQPAIEEPQGVSSIGEARACNCPGHCSDVREESSFIIEAMELSGPR